MPGTSIVIVIDIGPVPVQIWMVIELAENAGMKPVGIGTSAQWRGDMFSGDRRDPRRHFAVRTMLGHFDLLKFRSASRRHQPLTTMACLLHLIQYQSCKSITYKIWCEPDFGILHRLLLVYPDIISSAATRQC